MKAIRILFKVVIFLLAAVFLIVSIMNKSIQLALCAFILAFILTKL